MNDVALVDTGFWIALFDPREPEHADANRNAYLIEQLTILVPWPILYETLRTRFVRRSDWILRLDSRLKQPNTVFIDDESYCSEAYSIAVEHSVRFNRPISMVDILCRLLIEDPNINIDYMITINRKDFHDVCRKHNVELI